MCSLCVCICETVHPWCHGAMLHYIAAAGEAECTADAMGNTSKQFYVLLYVSECVSVCVCVCVCAE